MPNDKTKKSLEQTQLQTPIPVDTPSGEEKEDACERVLRQLKQGLRVTLTEPAGERFNEEDFVELNYMTTLIRGLNIDFKEYQDIMDALLNTLEQENTFPINIDPNPEIPAGDTENDRSKKREVFPISGDEDKMLGGSFLSSTHAYNLLKYATEKYLRLYFRLPITTLPGGTLPYIQLVERKLERLFRSQNGERHFRPMLLELIWSYWHEEGMVVQTINAIARRFQNVRNGQRDPLANLELHPLRPLNNILWGYIQDASNRLTPIRRAYEYNHHYGITLLNARRIAPADSRSYFIQSFHNLLNKCAIFYREADNLIKVADALPVLNALREVHIQLAEGAHNQFGDLPLTSRVEMLLEQYILSRPEIREFLGGRTMVPNNPSWIDIVDTMKTLQGWNLASTTYFRDLAVFGEQILLTIRWISWSEITKRSTARAWAIRLRDDIQRYIHCYQAVTGVDLSLINVTNAANLRSLMPAVLIRKKLERDMMMMRRR